MFGFLVHSPVDIDNSNKSCNVGGVTPIISIPTTSDGVAVDTSLSNTRSVVRGAASTNSINKNNDVAAVPFNNNTFDIVNLVVILECYIEDLVMLILC